MPEKAKNTPFRTNIRCKYYRKDIERMEQARYKLTPYGEKRCEVYITEMKAYQKEILDAGKDTCNETFVDYTTEDIFNELLDFGIDSVGEIMNGFGVTDNYNMPYPLCLRLGEDFILDNERTRELMKFNDLKSLLSEGDTVIYDTESFDGKSTFIGNVSQIGTDFFTIQSDLMKIPESKREYDITDMIDKDTFEIFDVKSINGVHIQDALDKYEQDMQNSLYFRVSNGDNTVATTILCSSKEKAEILGKASNVIKCPTEEMTIKPVDNESFDIELLDKSASNNYELVFPFSNAISLNCLVQANNLTAALDILADYLLENKVFPVFYRDYYEIAENLDGEYSVEEYAELNNLICIGSEGIYMETPAVKEYPIIVPEQNLEKGLTAEDYKAIIKFEIAHAQTLTDPYSIKMATGKGGKITDKDTRLHEYLEIVSDKSRLLAKSLGFSESDIGNFIVPKEYNTLENRSAITAELASTREEFGNLKPSIQREVLDKMREELQEIRKQLETQSLQIDNKPAISLA